MSDWAYKAATAILDDLSDRRGIKSELGKIDDEIMDEITITMADIIRKHAEQEKPK